MGELAAGSVFAGHRIEDVAGRGGMGVVYRATQLALDRTVALKVIAPGLLEDQTMRARFVRESKVAASIDHPNVIPIYYAGEENGIAYIAMRYVGGDDIRSLVRREGKLPAERAARLVAQIGAALDAAHAAGLVHRDIKPANVLLGPEDHVYLTDFGLTKHVLSVAGSTKPGHWVGTLDYVAPEQIRGERVDARADVYALGCLLYYALTGGVPFARDGDEAKLWAHLSDAPPKPSAHGAPEAFDAVIERALAKNPDERYPSAGDLGRATLAAAAGRRPAGRERLVATGAAAPVEAETISAARPVAVTQGRADAETVAQEPSRVHRARRPALLGAALLVAAGVGVAAAVALGVGDGDPPAAGTPTPTPGTAATPTAQAPLRVVKSIKVGERPNVARALDGNLFVGSFKRSKLAIISAKTGKLRSHAPDIGIGVNDSAAGGGALWLAVSRSHAIVKLDPRSGRVLKRLPVNGNPGSVAVSGSTVWAGIVSGNGQPDTLLKLDAKTGRTLSSVPYPFGIASLATSPSALWVVSRRRARVYRADPRTGERARELRVGSTRGEDAVYGKGALWVAVPDDDTVYKVVTATGSVIPISVGRQPRQVALVGDTVYVTNYSSSNLYEIDAKDSRVVGDPVSLSVNPFAIAADGGTVWVTSQPDNVVSVLSRDRGG
ncbi:protein kinase domain-containing protein [Candidatus Solirubrobacter pratensis]|uniref:protein kinase domain-containing protein n=1 Tax=Candidatus Solirubrobacter pratensis TaxID=1298857 RepID=UPI0012DED42F|nr:protein kinase [Candidatus Solirubrobacter pratensis]